jgi:carbon-monoxide dehydrogenase medium subunit
MPLEKFYRGAGETVLAADEILTDISIPTVAAAGVGTYRSMTPRSGDATVAGVAVRVVCSESGRCSSARIGLTNAGDRPRRATAAESLLEGDHLDSERIGQAASRVRAELSLEPDPLFSTGYREHLFEGLTERALYEVIENGAGGQPCQNSN